MKYVAFMLNKAFETSVYLSWQASIDGKWYFNEHLLFDSCILLFLLLLVRYIVMKNMISQFPPPAS
jgi:hypothetical protein